MFKYVLFYRTKVGQNWPVVEAVTQEVLLNHGFDLAPVSSACTVSYMRTPCQYISIVNGQFWCEQK